MDPDIQEEISEYPFDPLDPQINQREDYKNQPARLKRGPAKLQDQWTGVISLHRDNLSKIRTRAVENDIAIVKNIDIPQPKEDPPQPWKPLFSPPEFCSEHE